MNTHQAALEDLLEHPWKIDVFAVQQAYLEHPLYAHGREIGRIDILYHLKDGLYVPVEFKSNDTAVGREKAKTQLLLYDTLLRLDKKIPSFLVYAYDWQEYKSEDLIRVGVEGGRWIPRKH